MYILTTGVLLILIRPVLTVHFAVTFVLLVDAAAIIALELHIRVTSVRGRGHTRYICNNNDNRAMVKYTNVHSYMARIAQATISTTALRRVNNKQVQVVGKWSNKIGLQQ